MRGPPRLLRKPSPGRAAGDSGIGGPGQANQEALFTELGEARQQGVYHADPLVCRQCGGKLKAIAYVSDEISVKRILAALGPSPPEEEKPPPIREVIRVPVDDEGRDPGQSEDRTAPSILTLTP